MKVVCLSVINTGLSYVINNGSVNLCSFPTKRLAIERAKELALEFGVDFKF